MKNLKKWAVAFGLTFGLQLATPQKTEAIVAGALTSGTTSVVLLSVGGFFGVVGVLGATGVVYDDSGIASLTFIIAGVMLKSDSNTQLKNIDIPSDLNEKLKDGIYSQTEVDTIKADIESLKRFPEKTLIQVSVAGKAPHQIKTDISKTLGVQDVTSAYLAAMSGIQVQE